MVKKKKEDEKVLISIEMPLGQREQLKKLAEAHERSYSYVLRKLAQQAIEVGAIDLLGYRDTVAQQGGVKGGVKRGERPLAARHRASDV